MAEVLRKLLLGAYPEKLFQRVIVAEMTKTGLVLQMYGNGDSEEIYSERVAYNKYGDYDHYTRLAV
jgi:hypothetical protein